MKTAQLLAIYKDSIIADAGKVVTDSRKFDAVRTDALRKVRTAILEEILEHISGRLNDGLPLEIHEVVDNIYTHIDHMKDEP